jgi:D-proline reductase (dithiol) PrdB
MTVDSYRWLPPALKTYFETRPYEPFDDVPWTPLRAPLAAATVALVTTAGINVRGVEPPFDYEREKAEPRWGDPSFRTLPRDVAQEEIQTGHLHINNEDLDRDIDVAFPVHRLLELEAAGVVGRAATHHYSFMGFQEDLTAWRLVSGPEVARRLVADGVQAVLLTPV